jgi:transcriptional regulator with XRE-family HTH domain
VIEITDKVFGMPPEEIDKIVEELRAWTKEARGRQKQLADALGIDEALLSNWIAGRKRPGLKYYFALQAFLKKHRDR